MEDKGFPTNQGDGADKSHVGLNEFKLPLNYAKIKKEISKASELSPLISFLNEKTSNSSDVVDFCKSLLEYKEFKSFKTIHFFKHEKGQSFALKYEITKGSDSAKDFHINEFNHLFQAIKKSKNRTFGQDSLKGFDFDILGTFLAREFALGNHNIILIVSRNDFLSQTKDEKAAFTRMMKVIAPYFNIILDKELGVQHHKNTELAFKNLPYTVKICEEAQAGHANLPSGKSYKVDMGEALDKADVYHQERIALLGELLNTLKHELSNPLFGLQLSAELLCQEFDDEEQTLFMQEICSSIKRSQSIISNFTELYTSSEGISAGELEKMVHEIFTLTKSQSRHIRKDYKVEGAPAEGAIIEANSVWLAQILFNLVVNSAQALNQAGLKDPSIEIVAKFGERFELHVRDNGPGAAEDTVENMFKPFYTTKEKGTGLGLAISQSLAKKLNGKLDYIPQGQGAHFVLTLGS